MTAKRLAGKTVMMTFVLALVAACGAGARDTGGADYDAGILEWRKGRLDRLMAPTGFLTLAGLFWLSQEVTTFGSDAGNDLVFPPGAAPRIGNFVLTDDGVVMQAAAGVDVSADGEAVDTVLVADDTTDSPVLITHGSLAWTVIKRDGRYAVRLRDFENPALETFPPLDYFPIDPAYRSAGTLVRYPEPRTVAVDTVIEGLGWNPESPGIVRFELGGRSFELEAYASGEQLFFVFGDTTNRRETYPAGRFLYAELPAEGDRVVLDFNRSYSPPCAFNDFSTCPVASPGNRLDIAVEAGEKFNRDAYVGSVSTH